MSQFVIDCSTIAMLGQKVGQVLSAINYNDSEALEKHRCQIYGECGCGVGGDCSNSCVSGCAERGGCGPHGPK